MKMPEFIKPQLAILSDQTPQGAEWIHEIKFDGYRTLAHLENHKIKMLTRNGLNWSDKYSFVAEELKKLPVRNFILDGEIVALDENKRSNFLTLQDKLKSKKSEDLQYYIFDILYLEDEDLRSLPLIKRKQRLQKLLSQRKLKNIFYSEHFSFKGEKFFKKLCSLDFEGLISKLVAKPYFSGRNEDWLKSKCHKRQEFVIGGFTLPSNEGNGIGALLVGYYKDKKLIYSSKVGTGFNQETALDIRNKLEKLKDKSHFLKVPSIVARKVIYVKPKLICEVEFSEWTKDGALRHPSFQGLRLDKKPQEINRDYEINL